MPWLYEQATGKLSLNKQYLATGYSGHPPYVNDPSAQERKGQGPIPCGLWVMEKPFDSLKHGPCCIPLTPGPDTNTFGRSGFLMHGDNKEHLGEHVASEGCMIMPPNIRHLAAKHPDRVLEVVPGVVEQSSEVTQPEKENSNEPLASPDVSSPGILSSIRRFFGQGGTA